MENGACTWVAETVVVVVVFVVGDGGGLRVGRLLYDVITK